MSHPSTAREALIVEAIGEVATLIDRMEAMAPALDASRLALIDASAELAGQITAFESRMAGITENAKVQAVKHIARRTDEMARASQTAQVRAMEEAAQALFRAEVGPAIQRLVVPSQHLAQLAQRSARPSEGWLTHAATAVLSAAGSAWLVYLLIGR